MPVDVKRPCNRLADILFPRRVRSIHISTHGMAVSIVSMTLRRESEETWNTQGAWARIAGEIL
jgi:hypothetical protein